MKAWVIKNKEGEYKREDVIEYVWKETTSYFSKDIRCADIFTEEEMAKCYCPKDCEVVEITIVEGDLEQEIEELKTRISELQDKDWYEACIKQLEEQNDKLIKEVEEIKKDVKSQKSVTDLYLTIASTNATKMNIAKAVRKQVCDEIRKEFENCYKGYEWNDSIIIGKACNTINSILDKIGKGEE